MTTAIKPFRISVGDDVLDDLSRDCARRAGRKPNWSMTGARVLR